MVKNDNSLKSKEETPADNNVGRLAKSIENLPVFSDF